MQPSDALSFRAEMPKERLLLAFPPETRVLAQHLCVSVGACVSRVCTVRVPCLCGRVFAVAHQWGLSPVRQLALGLVRIRAWPLLTSGSPLRANAGTRLSVSAPHSGGLVHSGSLTADICHPAIICHQPAELRRRPQGRFLPLRGCLLSATPSPRWRPSVDSSGQLALQPIPSLPPLTP